MAYVDGSSQRGGKAYHQHGTFLEMIRRRDNYTCLRCGKPGKDVHHIIPHAQGGASVPENLQVLCHQCNGAKGGKPLSRTAEISIRSGLTVRPRTKAKLGFESRDCPGQVDADGNPIPEE